MIVMFRSCAIWRSGFMSTVRPYRWTGMIAFVRGVIAAATAAASMFIVRSSTSTRMGRAFAYRIASTVAKNVNETVMTSSPAETPHARIASCSASVPLPTPTLCLVPMNEANSWSNAFTFGPMVSCMLSRTSSIARRTSSRMVAYCAFRSTRGISCVATAVIALWSPSYLHPLRQVLEPRVGVRVDADEAREVADVVLELHRGVARPHRARRHRVADDASGADERVLADLDPRQDRGERTDDRARPDDQLELAFLLAARRTADDRVLADDAPLTESDVRRDHRGGVHRRRRTGAHARTGSSRYATRAPPDRSDRIASSSTRTTMSPASPSLRGFLPSRTHSMKWRISTCSASVIGTRGLWMSPAR